MSRRKSNTVHEARRQTNNGAPRPAQSWVDHAPFDLRCEGLDPGVPASKRRFADHHVEIVRGDRYFEKAWRTREGIEFVSRHCVGCGRELEGSRGEERMAR